MIDEHINKLKVEFPTLYANLTSFNVGDGWFKIIYKLSKELYKESKKLMKDKKRLPIQIVQLTSRRNKLVLYTAGMPNYCESWCAEAESTCSKTCEICGTRTEKGICKKCQQ